METGILFDLDGTLLDTLEDLTDATNYALSQYGCPSRTIEEIRSFVGNGAAYQIRCALPGEEKDPPLEQVLATYKSYYSQHAQVKTRPYEGILEALEALKAICPVALVSNKPDNTVKLLAREYFGNIYALGETSSCPRKPAPDMIYEGMNAIGVQKCIYVGDSEVDVLTAKNAGVPCLSVLWGFRDKEMLLQHGAEHFCTDPRQLVETLKSMM